MEPVWIIEPLWFMYWKEVANLPLMEAGQEIVPLKSCDYVELGWLFWPW